jgi:hypothetical protein
MKTGTQAMRKISFILLLFLFSANTRAQLTFKSGWNTYKTATIIHDYTYTFTNTDSVRLYFSDSAKTFATADSSAILTISYPLRDKSLYKTATYLGPKKQLLKTEDYKDDNMLAYKEWRYDDKNRKNYYYEENKINGKSYRKSYDYATDKKTGDIVVTESSFANGRIEFYTKVYYDKHSVKYKEVRLNDNNKDVVHIETYTYGENGKVSERTVYFPEWKVTKHFPEKEGTQLEKCFKSLPIGTLEKPAIPTKIAFMKKLILRNQALLMDQECNEFEYHFKGFNCEVIVATTGVNKGRKVTFRYTEKIKQ